MKRVNEFDFYDLAAQIHPLVSIAPQAKFSVIWLDLWNARHEINVILSARPFSVCANAASELKAAITHVVPEKWDELSAIFPADPAKEEPILPWKISQIEQTAKTFETVLAAECQVLDTYFISKKGAYSTADLIDHAHFQIPQTMRDEVPEQTRSDIDQAGKCIAFDLPTAAAFHLLRGTEAVLREFYNLIVPGPKRAAPKMRNWGVYIKLLKDHGAETKVTSLLDHLRDAYRNPVLHPEENYTDERALVLFGVCISAIVMMWEEIRRLTPKSPELPFPRNPAAQLPEYAASGLALLSADSEEIPELEEKIEPISDRLPPDVDEATKA
jgi:hypothetical protein